MIKRIILAALGVSVAAFAQTGGLTVSVQDSSGKGLSGARVAITALPLSNPQATATGAQTTKAVPAAAASAQLPIYNNSATTGANGVATFASIPAGVYTLCAYPTGQAVVDSCSWVVRPQSAVVTASTTASYTVQLKQAARVTVVISDSQQILATAITPAHHLQLGVSVPQGHWQPLISGSVTATSQSLSALVPVNTELKLSVGAYGLQVTNSAGKLFKSNSPLESVLFIVPSSGNATPIQLNIVGTI